MARRTRVIGGALATTCLLLLLTSSVARAEFGFLPGSEGFRFNVEQEEGGIGATQAGSHPYAVNAGVNLDQTGDRGRTT